ncbi:PEP-utilizing enzyme [Miltoncostaea marina]|uniref:PEP-utilizing enzyme n=1 Tax=Miltoncostaea marina TaxID=2843215 RepID=UPI001C3E0625|nr:PEP-utilizing enzyme [Miltoncostaea marina]
MIETDTTPTPLRLEPPGPGSWLLDAVHAPRPYSRFGTEIHPGALAEGFAVMGRRYGLLLDVLDWRMVQGFAYFAPRPVLDEAELPRRFAAAAEAVARRVWREDVERWERWAKPASVRAHLALQRVDPAPLSTDGLLAHLQRAREHQRAMIVQHHVFNGAALIPVGDFLAHAAEWTGLPPARVLALVRGAAPESAGSSHELDRLVAALAADGRARAALASDEEPGALLARLRAWPGGVGHAATAYLDLVGYRLVDSLDIGDRYALEVPEVIVGRLRVAVAGGRPVGGPSQEEVAGVRDLVPPSCRDEFDDLLAEARLTYRVRDERGNFGEVWAGGITRRVVLAAGERLVRAGVLDEPTQLAEAGYEEMRDLISGRGGPTADELAARARFRATHRAADLPPFLGDPPPPPPPLDRVPAAAARMMRALDASIAALFMPSDAESEARVVRGTGASPGVAVGVARVLSGPAELGRLRTGDILVTGSTTESFNIALPLVGAIVTDAGGILSHAAIVSREYGIPGVVGTRDATVLIPDGARVRVDGAAGEVEVLS